MKTNKFFAKKKPGQAMVEFALALPVLLLLLYGILEAGRLLFLYSTVVTASRQAVRYGSATGDGSTPGVKRFQDCKGIRAAANAVGYLGKFKTITMSYDTGPNTGPTPLCLDPLQPSDTSFTLDNNGTRLIVKVEQDFIPLVKLVPFPPRTITATSARTILYSVPIVVEQEQQEWFKNPTTLQIISDDPDPSEIGGWVTVWVKVTLTASGDPAPAGGTVQITGADANCDTAPITINNNGIGSCQIRFDTAGAKVITAFYLGDADNQASSAVADHNVTVYQTVTQILSDQPDPTTKNQDFVVAVKVTSADTNTPTGTVDVSGGGGVRCSFTLSMGLGSCALNFNNVGIKTLTATYNGDSTHLSSSVTESHEVLDGTPTPTLSPTATLIPSATPIPTDTPIPTAIATATAIPTAVASCNSITAPGGITILGNVMSITINNPYAFPLMMNDLTVTWNDDKGHTVGNKTLKLQKVTIGGVTIWTGNTINQYRLTIPTTATLASGNTIISFSFDQTYDNRDGTEDILIHWATPGCENNPIDVH